MASLSFLKYKESWLFSILPFPMRHSSVGQNYSVAEDAVIVLNEIEMTEKFYFQVESCGVRSAFHRDLKLNNCLYG